MQVKLSPLTNSHCIRLGIDNKQIIDLYKYVLGYTDGNSIR